MIRRREVNRYHNDGPDRNRQPPGEKRSPDRNVTVDVQNNSVEIDTPVVGIKVSSDPTIEQPYLVPLGIPGFYQSPVEPVDPHDCERWPDSPYCGGTGVNLNDFVDLGVDVSSNPCETCVTFSPTLGYVSLPPYTICKRKDSPECQIQPETPPTPEPGGIDPIDQQLMDYLAGYPPNCFASIQYAWHRVPDYGAMRPGLEYPVGFDGSNPNFPGPDPEQEPTEADSYGNKTYLFQGYFFHQFGDIRLLRNGPFILMDQIRVNNPGIRDAILYIKNLQHYYPVPTGPYSYDYSGYGNENFCFAGLAILTLGEDQPPFEPRGQAVPPPYPLPCTPCEDDMACCSSESEELLRLIARRLGTDQFPAKVPRSLSADDGNATTQIQSLTELMGWYIRQFDALVGQFPIEITFDDVDPLKEGDQKKTLKLPNIAEALAELMGVSTLTSINSNTLVDGMVRNLIEANAAKTYALKGQYLAQAIADYLSFDTKEVRTPVPCSFTPGQTEFDDLLRESDQKVELTHYDDQRDFEDELKELLAAAAVIKAVHYRKYRGSQDLKDQVKNRFKELINLAEKGSPNPSDSDDSGSRSDFDTFVEDVESGFANTAGISDTLNPYGKPYSQRPKIRELGNTSDQTDARNL